MMLAKFKYEAGFTLIESVMVIVITGILAGMVAVFIKAPVDSYFDMARRAELTDIADTATRRMVRDLRLALPNSVRHSTSGGDKCIEFIPTKAGGRYRAAKTSSSNGDDLDFSSVDTSFDMLGLNATLLSNKIDPDDVVVVYNDGFDSGDAYTGKNAVKVLSVVDSAATSKITLVATGVGMPFHGKQFPTASPANRFQVIPKREHIVSYVCSGPKLLRYSRTLTSDWAKPADCAAMVAGATAATLATGVTTCSILYQPPGSGIFGAGRFGIVSISLAIGDIASGESVNLYQQVSVGNTP
jgi:MSHA biogenesis protein MshO